MRRRNFVTSLLVCLGAAVSSIVVAVRRRPVSPVSTMPAALPAGSELELAQLVRDRIRGHLPTETTFDPFTLLAIAGFVLRVIQVCQAAAVLRQHVAVQRKPNGAVAQRLRARLRDRYAADHPETGEDAIASHVDAALAAFREATPDEIRQAKGLLDRTRNQPTEIELFEFTQDLSRAA